MFSRTAALAVLFVACAEETSPLDAAADPDGSTTDGASVDAGAPADAGDRTDATPIDAADGGAVVPPAGLVLAAQAAWAGELDGRALLSVWISLDNGVGGVPAPLGRTHFSLETDRGTIVMTRELGADPQLCADDLAIAGGASRQCGLLFGVPFGELPVRVAYAHGDRSARAELSACSPADPYGLCPGRAVPEICTAAGCAAACRTSNPTGACPDGKLCVAGECYARCSFADPEGLCEEGQRCLDGECKTPCSVAAPDGACSGGRTCFEGRCEFACGPDQPNGYCPAGGCFGGTCELACWRFALTNECATCLTGPSVEACRQDLTGRCQDVNACAGCPALPSQNVCSCASIPACTGCADAARTAWDCIAAACPACAR